MAEQERVNYAYPSVTKEGQDISAKDAIYSIFKYLMAWQVVTLIIYWFFQTYWTGSWQDVITIISLVILFGYVYNNVNKFKALSGDPVITPMEEVTAIKAIELFCERLGIDLTSKKDEQIGVLKALAEKQAEEIERLKAEVSDGPSDVC